MSAQTYSNPRRHAVIADWPSGAHRTTATFTIETVTGRGERATRTLINPTNGRACATKKLTYGDTARIVDGADGRTYILILVTSKSHLLVMQSTMQHQAEVIFPQDARYSDLLALLTTEE